MEQKEIINSIEKLLDSIEKTFNWVIVFFIILLSTGLINNNQPISVLGAKVETVYAARTGIIIFLLCNLILWDKFFRLKSFLNQLKGKENIILGTSKLLYHKWIANPFLFEGTKKINRIFSSRGVFLLSFFWMFCLFPVSIYMKITETPYADDALVFILSLFILLPGLGILCTIENIFSNFGLKPEFEEAKSDQTTTEGSKITLLGVRGISFFLGLSIGIVVNLLIVYVN